MAHRPAAANASPDPSAPRGDRSAATLPERAGAATPIHAVAHQPREPPAPGKPTGPNRNGPSDVPMPSAAQVRVRPLVDPVHHHLAADPEPAVAMIPPEGALVPHDEPTTRNAATMVSGNSEAINAVPAAGRLSATAPINAPVRRSRRVGAVIVRIEPVIRANVASEPKPVAVPILIDVCSPLRCRRLRFHRPPPVDAISAPTTSSSASASPSSSSSCSGSVSPAMANRRMNPVERRSRPTTVRRRPPSCQPPPPSLPPRPPPPFPADR